MTAVAQPDYASCATRSRSAMPVATWIRSTIAGRSLYSRAFETARFLVFGVCTVLCLWIWPQLLRAQVRALTVEDAIRVRAFGAGSAPSFSPDGQWLAYSIVRVPSDSIAVNRLHVVPWFARGADIYVTNLISRKQTQITSEYDNWGAVWSPDGRYLAFLSDRDGSGYAKLWVWNADDGTLRKASNVNAGRSSVEWMRDSHEAILASAIESRAAKEGSKDTGPAQRQASGVRVAVFDSSTNADSDPWSLKGYLADLVLVNVDNGASKVIVEGQIGTYKLSPDGARIAFTTAKRFEAAGSQQILFDFTVLNLSSGEQRVVAENIPLAADGSGFSWAPDSSRLCLRSASAGGASAYLVVSVTGAGTIKVAAPANTEPFGNGRNAAPLWDQSGRNLFFVADRKLWSFDLSHRETEQVAEIPGRQITQIISQHQGTLWALDGKSTIVLAHDDKAKQDGFYRINLLTGESVSMREGGQCYTCVLEEGSVAVSGDGSKTAFFAEDAAHPPDLWVGDPEFRTVQQVSHLNPQLDPKLMGTARLVEWLSDDGIPLKGALLLPSNYQAGKLSPLVVWVYGGSLLSNRLNRFGLASTGPLNMQLLATRGYAVLLPDAPQSPATPMLDLAKTVLPGVNKLIELGIADPERLAVVGHSYGGYTALSLIVQTRRFKAAISIDGQGDLFSLYGEMRDDGTTYGIGVTEHGQGAMGGTPWDRRDRFVENSPFFYFDRIQTPLLVIQGTSDTAIAPFLGDQTFVALRRLGKEVEYAKYEGEGHSPAQEWSYLHKVDLCQRMLRWLESHLKPNST